MKNQRQRIDELEDFVMHQARIIHQAYHGPDMETWKTCPKAICKDARRIVYRLGENQSEAAPTIGLENAV